MTSGWRYRAGSVTGVAVIAVAAVAIANHPAIETAFRWVPVIGHLPLDRATGREFVFEAGIATFVVLLLLLPLYKPQPRRILDIGMVALRRMFVALLALATIGYFDYTYRLPRATLLIAGAILLVAIPAWFVAIRGRPSTLEDGRTVIVADNSREIDRVLAVLDIPVFGYVSLPTPHLSGGSGGGRRAQVTDGAGAVGVSSKQAADVEYLGGLSRLEGILVEHDIDTAVFAFSETDREEFFGALATCHEYGVAAKIHREKADTVLVDDDPGSDIVDIVVEPWDWQDRVLKRAFDLGFAGFGLLVSLPLLAVISVMIKLDSPGPVFYSQERTAEFGGTFDIYKFRSMVPESEDVEPGTTEDRVTRVGRFLRQTHLDEIPQLWSILIGDMSVVGPRAVWTDEEHLLEEDLEAWRQRWFVRPGLTGLAQINGASSEDPRRKLRYDIEYIQQQSFWFDLKIVIRQVWQVVIDVVETVAQEE
jgi:lipopolysaccharide/colanic/teichoic acid biosynthesis glycosyltransferase